MRNLYLLLFSLIPSLSFADYTYTGQYLEPDIYFSTTESACAAILEWRNNEMPESYSYVYKSFSDFSGSTGAGSCLGDRKTVSNNQVVGTNIVLGKVYRSNCQAGVADNFEWPFGVKDPVAGEVLEKDAILPPWPVCSSGCMLAKKPTAPFVESCYTLPDQDQSKVYCNWNGIKTGVACATSDEPTPPNIPDCPSGYTSGASGCTPDTPPDPCEADPNAEGCTPPDPCIADPDAAGCPGGGDPGDGGGDPGDGGGDPGDGGGDPGDGGGDPGDGGGDPGDGGGDPGDGDGAAGGYMNCDAGMSCEGDAIACAQLEVQKQLMCDGQKADFPSQKDDIENFLDNPDYKPEEDEEIDLSSMFSEGTRFLPSSCPPPESMSLITGGGKNYRVSYEPLCSFASDIGYLIVIAAGIFYAVYVGRAVGGE